MNPPSLPSDSSNPSNLGNIPQSGVDSGGQGGKENDAPRARVTTPTVQVVGSADENESQVAIPVAPVASIIMAQFEASGALMGVKVLRKIDEGLEATRSIWSKEANDFIEVPDHKTRLAAVELYLAHTVGLPVQRSENLNINARAGAGQSIRRKATPMEVEALERRLARAKKEAAEESKAGRPPHTA